jgi:hypothetical protein
VNGLRAARATLGLAGVALIGVGLVLLVTNVRGIGGYTSVAAWSVGPTVLSDLAVMPAVALGGWLLARLVPRRSRGPVVGGLVVTAALIVVALPFVGRPGLRQDNPTLLDRNYAAGLAIAVGVVWLVVATAIVWRVIRSRRA